MIVRPAEVDGEEIYSCILERSPQAAASWYRAFLSCTEWIIRQPLACSFARENADLGFELRQALFKTRYGDPYRWVFTVVDDDVRILRVRGRGQVLLETRLARALRNRATHPAMFSLSSCSQNRKTTWPRLRRERETAMSLSRLRCIFAAQNPAFVLGK